MSSFRPFCLSAWLAGPAAAALLLLTPVSLLPAQAQAAQATPAPQSANSPAPASPSQTTVAVTSQPPADQRGIAGRAIDKVKQVAKSAGDIFSRVPCLPPKGGAKPMGSLPHVAGKLIEGRPVVIVAFGSSSTAGFGASSPEFNYPNRLAAQLRRQYPSADITVINAGVGGEDAPEMMKRLQKEVIDVHPDLVIWQVGTNAVLRNLDPADTAKLVEDGISRIQAAGGADIVLVDPQYSPRVTERPESASRMVRLLGKVAELRHVGIFPRFEVMREWHEKQALPVESFVIADGLHMNDWGYACFAQLLGDDIIRSVGQIKLGVNVPADVRTYRPM
ncbi:SGNH/GDSL hydrolase family protein [Bradyrhizobium sp. Cp5.3]|uniref:SGNH/GDSL hydrolase family protein n=1 Tax=Bradyrhizobium sp. Cp5.3 TaxID=443598 RepID=UPI0003F90282|nr:SGNH/GDSL hydrolase family protein [Bradyrhizobium sp. Cp5.3]